MASVPEGFELVETISDIPEGFEVVEAPEKQGLLQEVEQAFQKIPGAPQLSEFAAGVNRTALGALDFLGPDNINAILNLSGSKTRVPTLTQTLASEGGFVEPGLQRDILATAGEVAPVALGIGQLLRQGAAQLPALQAGTESTAAGVLRQAGQATPGQDVAFGAISGAGQEFGREVGGEPGAMIGAIGAPIAAIPLASAKNVAGSLLRRSAPTQDELRVTATGIYNSLDSAGVRIPAQSFDGLVSDITAVMRREGFDADLHPRVGAMLRRLGEDAGTPKSLQEMDILRRVGRASATSLDRDERRLGRIITNRMDDFLDSQQGVIPGGQEVGAAFRSARDLWGRLRRSEILDDAVRDAENQASGFENGIRTQFRSILKKINKGTLTGFTDDEVSGIRQVVQGTNAGNMARFLGKFGILDGVTSRSLTSLGGIGLVGAGTGSGVAAAAVPLVGQLSGALSQRMTQNNARMANSIIRAGRNANNIARAYVRNTPNADRDPRELAQLLLRNEVPIDRINLTKSSPLLSDAAILAAVATMNDEEPVDAP